MRFGQPMSLPLCPNLPPNKIRRGRAVPPRGATTYLKNKICPRAVPPRGRNLPLELRFAAGCTAAQEMTRPGAPADLVLNVRIPSTKSSKEMTFGITCMSCATFSITCICCTIFGITCISCATSGITCIFSCDLTAKPAFLV